MWDAAKYLQFADQRSRPFFDLMSQVKAERVAAIVDLGCGAGQLTRTLADRWPEASIIGVDSSPNMLSQARTHAIAGRLDFVEGDLTTWSPASPLDLIVSNAAVQWVGDHESLLPRLVGMLAPGGTLAVQVPVLAGMPSHVLIDDARADPRWASRLAGVGLEQWAVKSPEWYVRVLLGLGLRVDAWQTTYYHLLTGADPVLDWYKGTALRPLLEKLGPLAEAFLRTLAERLRAAYPEEAGVTLFPFPRFFFVATR